MPPLNYRIYSFSQFRADFVYCLQKKDASHGAGQACFWDFVGIVVYNLGFNCLTLAWAQSGCESVPLCLALAPSLLTCQDFQLGRRSYCLSV